MTERVLFSNGTPWLNKTFSKQSIDLLTSNLSGQVYETNQNLLNENQNNNLVFLVVDGSIKTYISDSKGQIKTLFFGGKGTTASEVNALLGHTSFTNVIVSEPSYIFPIPMNIFRQRLIENEKMLLEYMEQAAFKNYIMANQIAMLSFDNPYERVSKAMYWIFTTLSEVVINEKYRYAIPVREFTHQDIAEFTGLSRVSVSNVFIKFYKNKTIVKENNLYICQDIRKL